MRKFDKVITVSQFAQICDVSRQTLIYYDKRGLFHPRFTDKNGYRYYSLEQYEEFSLISLLVELHTPLSEIKNYLEHRNNEVFLALLDQKELEVRTKLTKLKNISEQIRDRRKITLEALEIKDHRKILIEKQPEEKIILSRALKGEDSAELSTITGEFEQSLKRQNIGSSNFGAVVAQKNLVEPFSYRIECFYIKTSPGFSGACSIKPGGVYASTWHKGGYDNLPSSYKRLISYLDRNNWLIAGDSYETDLIGSYTEKNEEEYLTRISIRVRKRG